MNYDTALTPRIPMQLTNHCLVASIQVDLNDSVLFRFKRDLLEKIRQTQTRAVLLDVSGVDIMDRDEFESIREIMHMARLMGARSMLVGIKPEIACSLMDFDLDLREMETALTLDQAFELLQPMLANQGGT
ncbi:STAS domain-containing protein [Blastopirellula marina]|uniref:Transcriptional regulator n=1 Tax=Blastopirellula marina TaxID=124 RepID=A0A2S8FLC5_9BACT|nr:STAS domain-containing protein [Blastopirellula marina]PQO32985.1 transcriptional regulator [Blastopirellula marina]PTL43152.1 STAS domain-containing protein [Blastopirellula marina]